ncbi:MAG: Dyp-type peroxidase domain-containing protein, partial [Acidimicrobiales bacterium]
MSRRRFLGVSGGALAGGVVAGGALAGTATAGGGVPRHHADAADAMALTVPFYGVHQGGITTPPQRHGFFATFDVTAGRRGDLTSLLRRWTEAAAELCGAPAPPGHAPGGAAEAAGGEA